MPERLRQRARDIRRMLGRSPMQKVIHGIEENGYDLASMDALEVYGEDGAFHTKDYASKVRSLEIWEVDESHESTLKRNFPDAVVRIVNSYARIKLALAGDFDLVVVDNPMAKHGDHFEHFDLFPDIFRVIRPGGVLVLNVILGVTVRQQRRFPYLLDADHVAARSAFYGGTKPFLFERQFQFHYTELAKQQDREVLWSFSVQRHFVHYLVLGLD
jgi:SAM-dependent methyltransferase